MNALESTPASPGLTAYLAEARWFGGKGRPFRVTRTLRLGVVPDGSTDPGVAVDLVVVTYDDGEGGEERYQLPLSCYREPQERLGHALVDERDDPDFGPCYAYDALHDREGMAHWLTAFSSDTVAGDLVFHRVGDHELDLSTHSTLFTGEQSNSSVAFGDDSLLKVFRKLTPGVNPDVELHEVLSGVGSECVAELFGWLESPAPVAGPNAPDPDASVLHLAMLQQFLRTASDGWELASASVRDLYAEADLRADEVGGDFAAESERLGETISTLHHQLAEVLPVGQTDLGVVALQMSQRLDRALRAVPELAEHEKTLRAAYADLGAAGSQPVQRIHGDLHLGQMLRTTKGWKVVDFEGEPARPLAERRALDSVWRDVAGMLRSFDYAALVVGLALGDPGGSYEAQRAFRATEWVDRNSAAFLSAYAPEGPTDVEAAQLRAYVADKAVYETVYEARNRPAWVSVPLEAIARLESP